MVWIAERESDRIVAFIEEIFRYYLWLFSHWHLFPCADGVVIRYLDVFLIFKWVIITLHQLHHSRFSTHQ